MTTNIRQGNGSWVAVTPTPDGTLITQSSGKTLTAPDGTVYGINAAGQVTANGVPDAATWQVAAIGIDDGGQIYQINQGGICYVKPVGQWTETASPFAATPTPANKFGVRVSGHNLIDASGKPIQLRGVNISSLEGTPFLNDAWRGQTPNWAAIKSWGVNAVRIPLGEANWLGLCNATLANGVTPAIYQATVAEAVANANENGMYVILDLHWIVEGTDTCPQGQNAMADSAHSITFWTAVAQAFKNNPSVMFELFNEPQGNYPPTNADWNNYVNGQLASSYDTNVQAMVNAIRATGATNVIIQDGLNYASTFGNNDPKQTGYTDNAPGWFPAKDSLNPPQIVAGFHYYHGATYEQGANVVLNKGIPILVTEYGDQNNQNTDSASLYGWADPGGRASQALSPADPSFPGVGYFAWTWDAWAGVSSFILITDSSGTPTQGYGSFVKAHYLARAAANP